MTDLLLNEKLFTSKNKGVRNVARIRTLTVLRGLDVRRQRLVIEFLYEAQLISNQNPVVELRRADLSGIDLSNTYLGKVNWSNVNLSKAKFNPAYLPDADLSNSNLSDANLRSAHLDKANLVGANFKRVKTLEGATMPDGTIHD